MPALMAEGGGGWPLDAAASVALGQVAETFLSVVTRIYGTTRYLADDGVKVVERSPALQGALRSYASQVSNAYTSALRTFWMSWRSVASKAMRSGQSPLDAVTTHFKTIFSKKLSEIPRPPPGTEHFEVWKLFSGGDNFFHQRLLEAPVNRVRGIIEGFLWKKMLG
jgi:hypothetical protein